MHFLSMWLIYLELSLFLNRNVVTLVTLNDQRKEEKEKNIYIFKVELFSFGKHHFGSLGFWLKINNSVQ